MIAAALYTSESQAWNTPEVVLDRVREVGAIVLDPCSNESSLVGAAEEWRIERGEDGLTRPWRDDGLVYVNPPYDDLERWAAKMAREAARGCQVLACIPARTETVAFQKHILPTCTAIAFWRGRIKFGAGRSTSRQVGLFGGEPEPLAEGDNVAPFPTALPYWGVRPRRFARAFEHVAWTVVAR